MSDQRRLRSDLKQGLHQYLMGLYMSYTESMGEEEAKKLVLEVMEEQYRYFSPSAMNQRSAKDVLTSKIEAFTNKMDTTKDFDMQVYYAEKIDSLRVALDAMDLD